MYLITTVHIGGGDDNRKVVVLENAKQLIIFTKCWKNYLAIFSESRSQRANIYCTKLSIGLLTCMCFSSNHFVQFLYSFVHPLPHISRNICVLINWYIFVRIAQATNKLSVKPIQ